MVWYIYWYRLTLLGSWNVQGWNHNRGKNVVFVLPIPTTVYCTSTILSQPRRTVLLRIKITIYDYLFRPTAYIENYIFFYTYELRTGLPPFVINIVVLADSIHRSLYLPSTLCHILNIYIHVLSVRSVFPLEIIPLKTEVTFPYYVNFWQKESNKKKGGNSWSKGESYVMDDNLGISLYCILKNTLFLLQISQGPTSHNFSLIIYMIHVVTPCIHCSANGTREWKKPTHFFLSSQFSKRSIKDYSSISLSLSSLRVAGKGTAYIR